MAPLEPSSQPVPTQTHPTTAVMGAAVEPPASPSGPAPAADRVSSRPDPQADSHLEAVPSPKTNAPVPVILARRTSEPFSQHPNTPAGGSSAAAQQPSKADLPVKKHQKQPPHWKGQVHAAGPRSSARNQECTSDQLAFGLLQRKLNSSGAYLQGAPSADKTGPSTRPVGGASTFDQAGGPKGAAPRRARGVQSSQKAEPVLPVTKHTAEPQVTSPKRDQVTLPSQKMVDLTAGPAATNGASGGAPPRETPNADQDQDQDQHAAASRSGAGQKVIILSRAGAQGSSPPPSSNHVRQSEPGYVPPHLAGVQEAGAKLPYVPPHLRVPVLENCSPSLKPSHLRALEDFPPQVSERPLTTDVSVSAAQPNGAVESSTLEQKQVSETEPSAAGGQDPLPSKPAEQPEKMGEEKPSVDDAEVSAGPSAEAPLRAGPSDEAVLKTQNPSLANIPRNKDRKPSSESTKQAHDQPAESVAHVLPQGETTAAETQPSQAPAPGTNQDGPAEDASWASNEAVRSADGNGLLNWDGTWIPAPVEWETRPGWRDRHMNEHLHAWLNQSKPKGKAVGIQDSDLQSAEFNSGTAHIDGHELLPPPDPAEVLPNPEKSEKPGQTSNTAMLLKRIKVLERKLAHTEKQLAEALSRVKPTVEEPFVVYENPHAPKANIYLRHALRADLAACRDIYNHYSAVSIVVPESNPISYDSICDHFDDVRHLRLPWIVAVQRTRGKYGSPPLATDRVVGYAFADDYGDPRNAYRYTVEIQIFTHHQFLRLGVGKTLMDRLMNYLDPLYNPRGGYEFKDNDDFWGPGGQRVISKILCNISYPVDNDREIAWMKKWFSDFEFEEMGTLKEVGLKFNRWLNVLHLQRTTGSRVP